MSIDQAIEMEVARRLLRAQMEIHKVAAEQAVQMGFKIDEITENGEPPTTALLKHLFAREESNIEAVNQRVKILSDKITSQILKKLELHETTNPAGEGRAKDAGAVVTKKKSTRTTKRKAK